MLVPETIDLAVIAPCLNEAPNIPRLVERLDAVLSGMDARSEIVLVDDGSTDETWDRISEVAKNRTNIVPVRHRRNRGIVESWRSGLTASRAARLLTIDADLQYRPEDIPRLYEEMDRAQADFVQGRRDAQPGRSRLRAGLTWGLSVLLNGLFGMSLKDNKSGFVLYRRETMRAVLDYRGPYRHFQHFIAVAAHGLGYRIAQVPVTFDDRTAGASFIKAPLRFAFSALFDLPRAFVDYRLRPVVRRGDGG